MSHTKEPWDVLDSYTLPAEVAPEMKYGVAEVLGDSVTCGTFTKANAHRIAACVNACANLPEPEKNIRELVEALRAYHKSGNHKLGVEPLCLGCKALKPFMKKK